MLVVTLLAGIALAKVSAEEVACGRGVNNCGGAPSLTIIQNEQYCCDNGYTMRWVTQRVNRTSGINCVCDRQSQESDCLQGHDKCMRATSSSFDGSIIKCCMNGDSMRSISNSVVNGVVINSCKCLRHTNDISSQGFISNSNGQVRPMTERERAIFDQRMHQWQRNFVNQMTNAGRLFSATWLNPATQTNAPTFLQNLLNHIRQVSNNPSSPSRGNQGNLFQNLGGLTSSLSNGFGASGQPGRNPGSNSPNMGSQQMGGILDPGFWLGPNWRSVFMVDPPNENATTGATGQPNASSVNPYSQDNSVANPVVTNP